MSDDWLAPESPFWAAVTSPLRLRVLLRLERGALSTSEVAEEFGVGRSLARHHLAALEAAGLIVEASREPISGGPLIRYRAVRRWSALGITVERLLEQDQRE